MKDIFNLRVVCVIAIPLAYMGCITDVLESTDEEVGAVVARTSGDEPPMFVMASPHDLKNPLSPPEAVTGEPGRAVTNLVGTPVPVGPFFGGGGGTYRGIVSGGGIVYAMRFKAGGIVSDFGMAWYIPSQPDNFFRNGDFWTSVHGSLANGASSDPESGWNYCPAGYAGWAIRGRSGVFVDQMGLICRRIGAFPVDTRDLALWGGFGGAPYFQPCFNNQYLTGFEYASGSALDRVGIMCINQ